MFGTISEVEEARMPHALVQTRETLLIRSCHHLVMLVTMVESFFSNNSTYILN